MTHNSYQSSTPRFYPDEIDNQTRASYDSLAYSDITGEVGTLMTTVSAESRRLNGYTPRRNYYRPTSQQQLDPQQEQREDWIHQPRIRTCFLISVVLAVCTVFVLTSGAIDSEWLENMWEMGLKGARAQGIADASMIRTTRIDSVDHTVHLVGSSKHGEDAPIINSSPPDGCESTIMLIRHCEKGNLRSHCNYNGFERAAFLASQFGDGKERWPAPSGLYALKTGGRGKRRHKVNYREVETVQHIADKHALDINQEYKTSDHKKLARDLLESVLNGEQCGKLTLVSWKHSDLARLAQLLGCGPYEGCPMDYRGKEFDQVWQIKYVYRSFHHGPKAASTHKHWDIFGSVQYERFDPLAFSKIAGDYPPGGTGHAGRWVMPDQELFD